MKRILTALLLLGTFSLAAFAQDDDDAKYAAELLAKGTTAPAFCVNDLAGEPHTLAEFAGKYLVLDFWATWCPDCRKDIPKMKELWQKYGSDKLVFVGISLDTSAEALGNYVRDNEIGWLQLSELKKWKKGAQTADDYQVKWIPSIYVIGPDGKVLLATVMIDQLEAFLAAL